jgi:subtilisin family serine protease
MKNAISKGVIVVKAAGNSGSDGPFRADVATAVGSITVASVDAKDGTPVQMSAFSSYGPVSSSRPVVGRIEN